MKVYGGHSTKRKKFISISSRRAGHQNFKPNNQIQGPSRGHRHSPEGECGEAARIPGVSPTTPLNILHPELMREISTKRVNGTLEAVGVLVE